jgi:tetratricopeptide (TPR) repeat protein
MLLSFEIKQLQDLFVMRVFGLIIITSLLYGVGVSQETAATPPAVENTDSIEVPVRDTDKEAFAKATNTDDPYERANLLKIFVVEYEESDLRNKARELLSSVRSELADLKLRNDKPEESIALFKLAVSESPDPISDDLFSKVLVNIPTNLFLLGKRNAAFDLADMLEIRVAGNHRQLLRLATFHISIKYATGARRLIEKAIELKPDNPVAYQTLGTTNRLAFDLNAAAEAYQKGLEFEPGSISLKQNLADMKRALGKADEAETLYREILAVDGENVPAKTGVILSLFDQGKRNDAEDLLIPELSSNPTNGFAMIGAAYWYVANGEPQLALDYANQARILKESAVWAYVILARAHMKLNQPVEAERMLVTALQFGNSATISYELALAQSKAGFYYDASVELKKKFVVENGKIVTDLDGRIGAEADTFSELVSLERKSVLFAPANSYSREEEEKVRSLFVFEHSLASDAVTDEEIVKTAEKFIGDEDDAITFRRLYAAQRLLDSKKLPKHAMTIARESVGGVEKSAASDFSSSAVMADQLFEGRRAAAAAGRTVVIPKIDEPVLSKILRGRIEELTGRSFVLDENFTDAEVRFKRAVSVFPAKSAWWRSSMWRLGEVYEQLGQDQKALESYSDSYLAGDPVAERRAVVERVYTKLNGSLEGFEDMLNKENNTESNSASLFLKDGGTDKKEDKKPTLEPASEDSEADSNALPNFKLSEDVDLSGGRTPSAKALLKPVSLSSTDSDRADTSIEKKPSGKDPAPEDDAVAKKTPLPDTVRDEKPIEIKPAVITASKAEPLTPEIKDPDLPVAEKIEDSGNKQPSPSGEGKQADLVNEPDNIEEAKTPDKNEAARDNTVETVAEIKPGNKLAVPKEAVEVKLSAEEKALAAELIDLGATRPRFVSADKIAAATESTECKVVFSQERVSVFKNGGSFGIVVGLKNYSDAYVLRARSMSPENILITYEPDIGSVDGRAFFVIKSISERMGEYKVTFETPCGNSDVMVDVR